MIQDLVTHCGRHMEAGMVLESHLSPGETVAMPHEVIDLQTFLARWNHLPGIEDIEERLEYSYGDYSDYAFIGLIHDADAGVALFAFHQAGVRW